MTEHLNMETFKTKVFDFEKNQEWKFEGDIPCVIDFWAPWCGPCKMMAPILSEATPSLEPSIRVAKVDTESQQALAGRYQIRSIPTLALFHNGREIARQAGAMDRNSLINWVRSHLSA